MTKPDLLPCPFCGAVLTPSLDDESPNAFDHPVNDCYLAAMVDVVYPDDFPQWNTRTPNKSADVDLDALKMESWNTDVCHNDFCRVIDYLAASGHLATGKGDYHLADDGKPIETDNGIVIEVQKIRGDLEIATVAQDILPSRDEIIKVIEGKWDYLEIRHKLSEISGVGCMAITTNEHIKEIKSIVSAQNAEIKRLNQQLEKVKVALE